MVVEVYTVELLKDALQDKDFWLGNVVPITKHRAQLVINNPRSQRNDPVLFIAKEGEEIIGYRLVFPDIIYVDGVARRFGWGSSFWVNEQYRGRGIGRLLFEKSYELWKGNIGSLMQSRDAARIYERDSNFFCFSQSIGYQFIIRLNTRFWLRKRMYIPPAVGWVLHLIDLPVNAALGVFRLGWVARRKPIKNYLLEYCREIVDPETINFVESHNRKSLSRKSVNDLNSIVMYPTSLATPLRDSVSSRYFFNTTASRFDYLYVKVYDLNYRLKGLLLLNVDGCTLKLLYYFYESETDLPPLFDIFLLHAIRLKTELIICYDDHFNRFLMRSSGFPRLFSRKQRKKSFLPVSMKGVDFSTYKIYDGDGA